MQGLSVPQPFSLTSQIPAETFPTQNFLAQTYHQVRLHTQKPGGWDPPEIPGSMRDHPRPPKDHPSERSSSSSSLPEADGGSDKLQKDRGGYGLAKPPQTEDLIPSRGSPEAPLQESHLNETDSQVTNPCFCHSCI